MQGERPTRTKRLGIGNGSPAEHYDGSASSSPGCRWRIAHRSAATPEPTRHCSDPAQSKSVSSPRFQSGTRTRVVFSVPPRASRTSSNPCLRCCRTHRCPDTRGPRHCHMTFRSNSVPRTTLRGCVICPGQDAVGVPAVTPVPPTRPSVARTRAPRAPAPLDSLGQKIRGLAGLRSESAPAQSEER